MTQEEFLEELRSGSQTSFDDLMAIIDKDFSYTPAAFTNGELHNASDENQGSAKLFCFAAIHELSPLETLHCFGEHYQAVLADPEGDSHQNIRNFMTYGWEGLKFESPVLDRN